MPELEVRYIDYTGEDGWYRTHSNKTVKTVDELLNLLNFLKDDLNDEDFAETEIYLP